MKTKKHSWDSRNNPLAECLDCGCKRIRQIGKTRYEHGNRVTIHAPICEKPKDPIYVLLLVEGQYEDKREHIMGISVHKELLKEWQNDYNQKLNKLRDIEQPFEVEFDDKDKYNDAALKYWTKTKKLHDFVSLEILPYKTNKLYRNT